MIPSPTIDYRPLSDDEASVARRILGYPDDVTHITDPVVIEVLEELTKVFNQIRDTFSDIKWGNLTDLSDIDESRWKRIFSKYAHQHLHDILQGRGRLTKERGDRYLVVFRDVFNDHINRMRLSGFNVGYRVFRQFNKNDQRLLLPYMIKYSHYEMISWSKLARLNHRQRKKLLRKWVVELRTLTYIESFDKNVRDYFNTWVEELP